jgi:hypothetical protein
MTISCRPPEAGSDPTTERPAPDRNRVPSVGAILSLVQRTRSWTLDRPTAVFEVGRKRAPCVHSTPEP